MKTVRDARHCLAGGLLMALLGLVGVIYLGSGARRSALATAAHAVASDMRVAFDSGAIGDDPQVIARRLISSRSADLTFVTVRGPEHQLLASAGAWSGWFDGLVSRASARTWRAWLYRTLCAETHRLFAGGASMHIGVTWWRVLASAGIGFWSMLLLMVLGCSVLERERRDRSRPEAAPETSAAVAAGRRCLSMPGPAGAWRDWLTRGRVAIRRPKKKRAGEARPEAAGFQPIGRRSTDERTATARETRLYQPV